MDARGDLRTRLAGAKVGVIGLGGLGSNVAAMLVRTGVRHLVLADFDTVDHSNLDRQLYFREDIGRMKTDALSAILRRIEPDLELELVARRVGEDDIVAIGSRMDVLVEATDCADTKALVMNVCAQRLPDLPCVAASGLAGMGSANEVITRTLTEHLWVVGDLTSDVSSGLPLVASRVMTAAAHQAHAVVRILLGYPGP